MEGNCLPWDVFCSYKTCPVAIWSSAAELGLMKKRETETCLMISILWGQKKALLTNFMLWLCLRLKHGKKQRQNLSIHAIRKDCHGSFIHLHQDLQGPFEIIWSFLNWENVNFYSNFETVRVQFQRNKDHSSEPESLAAAMTWLRNWLLQQMHEAGPRTSLSVPFQVHTL